VPGLLRLLIIKSFWLKRPSSSFIMKVWVGEFETVKLSSKEMEG